MKITAKILRGIGACNSGIELFERAQLDGAAD